MKRFILFTAILAILLPLVGCHGNVERRAFEVPAEFDTGKSYEISFWAKNDTNKVQTGIYEKAIADFEALYPNIKVKLKLYTDYGRIYNDVITNISTGTTPNVCITYPDHIATYLTGAENVVMLDELFVDEKYGLGGSEVRFDSPAKDEVIPKFLDECHLNGGYYALPYMRSSEVCYVNRTYIENMGYTIPEKLTWDFIWEVSAAAMEKDGDDNFKVNGQKVLIPFIYKSTDNMMIQLLRQMEADYSAPDGTVGIFNDTTEGILENVAKYAGSGAFSTFKIVGYPGNFFNAGQCLFAVDSTAGATWMGTDAPLVDIHTDRIAEFETIVMELPQTDPEKPAMISQGPSVCVFNKEDPQEVLASWLFTQFLLTNDVQVAYAQTEGYVPVTSKAQKSEAYLDYLSRAGEDNDLYYSIKMDATKILLDNIDNTFVTSVFNGSTSLRNAAGHLIEDVSKAAKRGDTVDHTYIEKLYSETAKLYRLDSTTAMDGDRTLGDMPLTSVILLSSIAAVWLILAVFAIRQRFVKNKFTPNQ